MARKRTAPMVEADDMHGQKFTHPSYAVVNLHRCSGDTELFDSAMTHQHYIAISIKLASKHTNGAHDFIFGGTELIEVAMSESQFARAITSMNMGSGAPCTLQRYNGEMIDQPEAEDRLNSHRDMVADKLGDAMERQEKLGAQVAKWRAEKHRPTLKELDSLAEELQQASAHFQSNMTYYAGAFEEHMERVVDDAKTEVEAHMLASAGRLGLDRDELPKLEPSRGTICDSE